FLFGNSWGTEETVPFECGIDDGSGNINRTYVVGTGITTLPIVCWEQCQPCPLNTTDIQLQNFVYPNPASEFVAIPRQLISSEFSIYNALGNLIYSGKSEVNQTLAVSSWPNGIYFILSQKESFKFIVEHEN
ncbi:MAG: T9SS type A sorting domain-containing protein, partial [Bacteroidota bacterium]